MYTIQYDRILLWGFIWVLLVSMLDHYLAIKFQENLLSYEWNPLGILLIKLDAGSVALFMTLKMGFLWGIAAVIVRLYSWKKEAAYASIVALCIVQFLLMIFFIFG